MSMSILLVEEYGCIFVHVLVQGTGSTQDATMAPTVRNQRVCV